jgi:hypothetical protein
MSDPSPCGHTRAFEDKDGEVWCPDCQTLNPADPDSVEGIKPADVRELLCQRCNQEYPVWYAPNELWNAVQREGEHFFCLTCFAVVAEERGVVTVSWILRPQKTITTEGVELSQAKQRAREFLEMSDAEKADEEHLWKVIPRHLVEFAESESWADRDELDDLQACFNLRWEADMRAIKRWKDAHPEKPLTWPDHVDLVTWLDDQLVEALNTRANTQPEREVGELEEAAEAMYEKAVVGMSLALNEGAITLDFWEEWQATLPRYGAALAAVKEEAKP